MWLCAHVVCLSSVRVVPGYYRRQKFSYRTHYRTSLQGWLMIPKNGLPGPWN
ncbi:hypothetical protein CGRA01v4_03138 [Colletotrichum graminicola]|nr:hypothetical protein CGRA01v4_03138 [Colletotrichum graminicola]